MNKKIQFFFQKELIQFRYGILIIGPLLYLKLQLYLWKTCQELNSTEFQHNSNFQFDKSIKITKANKKF